ncbi:MAG: alpha/beta hydrolase [Oscillospiraceae bacterium]|nr:alpha/beta hydrolase [Oscillospiraceae bacterium]
MSILKKVGKSLLILLAVLLVLVVLVYVALLGRGEDYYNADGGYSHIDGKSSFIHIGGHPGLEGLGEDVLPWDGSLLNKVVKPLRLRLLIPFLGKHEATVVDGINYTIDRYSDGSAGFLDYYSESDKAADPSKSDTGLVYYKTAEGAPFVLVVPGGSFTFVGVASSGYPYASHLQDAGYNVFILEYRVGQRSGEENKDAAMDRAGEDMLSALDYILAHADELGVSAEKYLLLGSSAGRQMTVRYCAEGHYAQRGLPAPSGCIMLYPANCQKYDYTGCTIPMYITACADDPQIDVPGLDRAVEAMEAAGMTVSYNRFETGGHSFGVGVGTPAEGWLERSCAFMEPYVQ